MRVNLSFGDEWNIALKTFPSFKTNLSSHLFVFTQPKTFLF